MQVAKTSSKSSMVIGSGDIKREGNKIRFDNYELTIGKDEVLLRDTTTGKTVRIWGDPHVHTSDGDKAQFHENNLTIDLPGGAKLTIVPTEKNAKGHAYIDKLALTSGSRGIEVENIHGAGDVRFSEVRNAGREIDLRYEDGTVLHVGSELDDLFFYDLEGNQKFIEGTNNGAEHGLDGLGGSSNNRTITDPEKLKAEGAWGAVRGIEERIRDKERQLEEGNLSLTDQSKVVTEIQSARQEMQLMIQMITDGQRSEYESLKMILQNLRA